MPMLSPREHVAGRDGSSSGSGKMTALVLIGAAAYLYLNLFYSLGVPFLLGGDQVFFWLPAMRMLEHARIYQDFYQFTPPGIDLIYFGLFRVFGPHVWVTNAFVLVLGVALCWMCFSIARMMMSSRAALFATVLFLILIYCKLLNGTHHWLSVLCVMCAVRVRMRSDAAWTLAASGALLGLASFFTQTRGVAALLAFVAFLLWRRLRYKRRWIDFAKNCGLLLSGFAASWFLLNSYFIATVGLEKIWHFQVTHVRLYVVHGINDSLLGLPYLLTWHTLPKLLPYLIVYLLLPMTYFTALLLDSRDRRVPIFRWQQVTLLALVGFFLMIEMGLNLNWLRLYAVSMPAFILLGWFIDRIQKVPRYAMALACEIIVCLAGLQTASRRVHQSLTIALPGGTVATGPEAYAKLLWFSERTKPGDYFFQAAWPGMYLPLSLRDPSYLETVARADGPAPSDVKRVPLELEAKQVQFVLWSTSLDFSNNQPLPADSYLPLIHDYLLRCYSPEHVFADGDEVWKRKDSGSCKTKEDSVK
jgi:hypothetical protein